MEYWKIPEIDEILLVSIAISPIIENITCTGQRARYQKDSDSGLYEFLNAIKAVK